MPQGCVISPLLFLIFINDLLDVLPNGIGASLYADDLALFTQSKSKEVAQMQMNEALIALKEWSTKWKLDVNVTKTECAFFSTDPHEARWRPEITFGEEEISFNRNPTFLGLTLDRTLAFNAHCQMVRNKMTSRLKFISALKGTKWGCNSKTMRPLFTNYVRATAEYGMAAWFPPTAATTIQKLETVNNRAARTLSGCGRTSPTELLLDEADIVPLKTRGKILTATAMEKALRLPRENPRFEAANGNGKQRLQSQCSWRIEAKKITKKAKIDKFKRSALIPIEPFAPWDHPPNVCFNTDASKLCKKDAPAEDKLKCAKMVINALPVADMEIFTDGSVDQNLKTGGAGFVVQNKVGNEKFSKAIPAGFHCSSYRAELIAMNAALDWVMDYEQNYRKINLYTDSLSLVQCLDNISSAKMDAKLHELWCKISRLFPHGSARSLTIIWIPGHCGIVGNEEADRVAKLGLEMRQNDVPLDFSCAKTAIRRKLTEELQEELQHGKYAELYNCKKAAKISKEQPQSIYEQKIISQLRCNGHCSILHAYRHRIGLCETPTCPKCAQKDEDLKHCLLTCPATTREREKAFGAGADLKILWEQPQKIIEFLQCTGRIYSDGQSI